MENYLVMDVIKLLDESSQEKLKLIDIVHAEYKNHIDIDYLVEKTKLSKFKVKKTLEELESDLDRMFQKKFFEVNRNEISYVLNISNLDILKLKLFYAQKSVKFKLFEFLLFSNESLEAFTKSHFIGVTKLYSVRQHLAELLRKEDIKVKNNNLLGKEPIIRLVAFESYYYFFNGIEYPFLDSTKEIADRFIRWLEHQFLLRLTNSEKNQLSLFLSINYLRIKKGHYLNSSQIKGKFASIEKITTLIQKEVHLTKDIAMNEAKNIYMFLYINEIIPNDGSIRFEEIHDIIEELNNQFILGMEKFIFDEKVKENYFPTIKKRIQHIHEKLLLMPNNSMTFIDDYQIQYFEENYYVFHIFVKSFVAHLQNDDRMKLDAANKTKLYFDYMFELIEVFPLDSIEAPIYITVNFSHGHSYSSFIARNLESFPSLNVIVEWRVSHKTDIYMSDFYFSSLPYEQIIWRNPPDEYDWEELIDKVIELRSIKNNEQIKKISDPDNYRNECHNAPILYS